MIPAIANQITFFCDTTISHKLFQADAQCMLARAPGWSQFQFVIGLTSGGGRFF
jgi:hypothetical protein